MIKMAELAPNYIFDICEENEREIYFAPIKEEKYVRHHYDYSRNVEEMAYVSNN